MKAHILVSIIVLFAVGVSTQDSSNQDECIALVFQGAQDLGAWQAGVVQGLVQGTTNPTDVQYDVISGISMGALNAALMSQFPKGSETQMVKNLTDFWNNLQSHDVYKTWGPLGIFSGLKKPGLYNNAHFSEVIDEYFGKEIFRKIAMTVTNLDSGLPEVYSEKNSQIDIKNVLMSSQSYPGMFPYQNFNGHNYGDGATTFLIDVESAVLRCREIVDSNSKITMDVIMPIFYSQKFEPISDDTKTYEMIPRTIEVYLHQMILRDWIHVLEDFPDITLRYVVTPQNLKYGVDIFTYDQEKMQSNLQQGIQDGMNAVQKGKSGHLEKVKEFLREKEMME